jgi:hypothetical protein
MMQAVPGGWVTSKRFILGADHSIVLSNWTWWEPRKQELDAWCRTNDCVREGIVVIAATPEAKTLFLLKWST